MSLNFHRKSIGFSSKMVISRVEWEEGEGNRPTDRRIDGLGVGSGQVDGKSKIGRFGNVDGRW